MKRNIIERYSTLINNVQAQNGLKENRRKLLL